jgi:hypothetical protein
MNEREEREATEIACQLWRHFNAREWDAARKLLADDFEATWPQSRERIVGADNFIALNRDYPGNGEIQVEDSRYGYDRWEHIHEVTTTVRIRWNKPDGSKEELYAISFFEIERDGFIKSAVEYWAETYPAPEWRRKYVEVANGG